jgi:hypothetical protein
MTFYNQIYNNDPQLHNFTSWMIDKDYEKYINAIERNTVIDSMYLNTTFKYNLNTNRLINIALKCKQLKFLHFSSNISNTEDMELFMNLLSTSSTLEKLWISSSVPIKDIVTALSCNTYLKQLSFNNITLSENDFSEIAQLFLINKSITHFNIANAAMTPDVWTVGIKYISAVLKQNTTLEILGLTNINFREDDIEYLSSMLSVNKTLHTLNFKNNVITDNILIKIIDAISINNTIITLCLINVMLSNVGLKYLAKYKYYNNIELYTRADIYPFINELNNNINNNYNLTILKLDENIISVDTAKKIGELLVFGKTNIHTLSMCSCHLHDEHLSYILAPLSSVSAKKCKNYNAKKCKNYNTNVVSLDISHNYITQKSYILILKMIKHNKHIRKLCIANARSIMENSINDFRVALDKNVTLTEFLCGGTLNNYDIYEELTNFVKRNKHNSDLKKLCLQDI